MPYSLNKHQVSRTLLNILADLNNDFVWMVSTHPLISKSFSPSTNPLVTVPSIPITIAIIVTFMFHSFYSSLARSRYLSLFLHYFSFTLWSAGTAKTIIRQVLFFRWLSIGLVVWPRLGDPFVYQNPTEFCVSFSRTDSGLCIHHLSVYSNLDFLHNLQRIAFPTQ